MPYVLSIEKIARQEGLQEGRQEGLQEGRRTEAIALLSRLLTKKFGALTPEWEPRLAAASLEQLEMWGETLLDATSLNAVFGNDNQ